MSDNERFEVIKGKLLQENEENYGTEIRQKYGDERVNESNRKMMDLTEAQFTRWQELDAEILRRLETGIGAGIQADSEDAEQIVLLHKEWLTISTPNYSPQMHRGIAAMYIADERFTQYYDRNRTGCAQLLHDAVQHWI